MTLSQGGAVVSRLTFHLLIEEILATGLTEDDIARRVNTSQASINRIKSGSQNPKYDLGAALVALHKEVVIRQISDRRVKDRRAAPADADAPGEKAA